MIRVIFFGTHEESLPALNALVNSNDIEIVSVITGKPKAQGRHQEVTKMPVEIQANSLAIPVWYFEDTQTIHLAQNAKVDAHIVVSFGAILSSDWLAIPKKGTINVHPSLLPLWRGPTPVPATLLAGNTQTGVSIMLMDSKMDHGPILWQSSPLLLTGKETTPLLLLQLMQMGADQLIPTLKAAIDGSLTPKEQEHEKATYCKLLSREQGFLAPGTEAIVADRMLHALTPWPGVWTYLEMNGKPSRLKIISATLNAHDTHPIQTLNSDGKNIVAGPWSIQEWQWEGKGISNASAFARSHPQWSAPLLPLIQNESFREEPPMKARQ